MSGRLALRVALGILLATSLLVGVWATIAPHSFFVSFPGLGHAWVAGDGPYNEHLVRDVGELNLALAVVTAGALAWLSRPVVAAAAAAWLVYSVPHFAYHAFNLQAVAADERVAVLVSLAVPILLGGVVLVLARGVSLPGRVAPPG